MVAASLFERKTTVMDGLTGKATKDSVVDVIVGVAPGQAQVSGGARTGRFANAPWRVGVEWGAF